MFTIAIHILDSDSGGFDYYGINLDVNSRFNPIHDHITTIHGYHNVSILKRGVKGLSARKNAK